MYQRFAGKLALTWGMLVKLPSHKALKVVFAQAHGVTPLARLIVTTLELGGGMYSQIQCFTIRVIIIHRTLTPTLSVPHGSREHTLLGLPCIGFLSRIHEMLTERCCLLRGAPWEWFREFYRGNAFSLVPQRRKGLFLVLKTNVLVNRAGGESWTQCSAVIQCMEVYSMGHWGCACACSVTKGKDSHFWKFCKTPEYKHLPRTFGRDYGAQFHCVPIVSRPQWRTNTWVSKGRREEMKQFQVARSNIRGAGKCCGISKLDLRHFHMSASLFLSFVLLTLCHVKGLEAEPTRCIFMKCPKQSQLYWHLRIKTSLSPEAFM